MKTKAYPLFRSLAVCGTAALIASQYTMADTRNWDGSDNATWADPLNWDTLPLTTDIAQFNIASYPNQPNAGTTSIDGIIVGATSGAVTITSATSGAGLSIGSSGINLSAATANLTLGAADTNQITLGADQTFNVASGRQITVTGDLKGNQNLAIIGGGTVSFGGNTGHTFGGAGKTITVSGGSTVNLGGNSGFPAGTLGSSSNKLVLNGGVLTYTPSQDSANALGNPIEFQSGGSNSITTGTTSNRGFFLSGALSGSGGFTTSTGSSYIALLNITGDSTLTGTVKAQSNTLMIASNTSLDALAGAGLELAGGNAIFTGSTANAGAIPNFSRSIDVTSNSSLGAGNGYTFTQTGTLTGSSTLSINTDRPGMTGNTTLANQVINTGSTSLVVLNGDVSGFSGGLTVSKGTLRFGSSATLPTTYGLMNLASTAGVNLDLNGRSITVKGLTGGGTTGGNVQGNSGTTANTLTINTTGTDRSYGGVISNGGSVALNLTKIGTNTQTLTGANTYTGTTTINGGTLATTTGANTTARIQGGGPLALGGGILSVTGSTTAATNVTQTFSGTTLNAGSSGVTSISGNATSESNIALGAITRNPGAQVNFSPPTTLGLGSITTETANTAGTILSGWATVASNNWATSAGSPGTPGNITAYSGYTVSNNATEYGTAGFSGDITTNGSTSGSALTGTINSLRFNHNTSQTVTITANNTLTIDSGGILVTSTSTAAAIAGGTIRGNATHGLNIFNRAAQELKIGSVIADNGSATALSITSGDFVTLVGTTVNTYSGQTYVNTGTRLRLGGGSGVNGSNANLGDQTVGAALNINGGALFYDGNFALDNAGANKRNVVIGSAGATFRPVPTASTDALTISGVISGSDFGVLTLGGPSTAFEGNLILTGNNTYNGGTVISGTLFSGAAANPKTNLILGNNNAIGTGALTFAGTGTSSNLLGLRSLDTTNLTLVNRIGDISGTAVTLKFGSSGTGNLTFTNTTTASIGTGNRTFQIDNAQTSFANGFSGASGAITKTGPGTLVFGGTNTYTGATTIKAGTLTLGASGSIAGTSIDVGDSATAAVLDVSAKPGSLLTIPSGSKLSGLGSITGNATISSGGKYAVAVAATDAAQNSLEISGALTLNSSSIIELTAVSPPAAGTYILATATGGITNSGATVTYGSITGGSVSISGNNLILTIGANNNYEGWANSQIPPVTGGPEGDFDNDGVKNLVEYALADGQERGTLTGNTLSFTKRGAPYGSDVTCTIQESDDLGIADSWQPVTATVVGDIISYTLQNPGDNFARLKVTQTTP